MEFSIDWSGVAGLLRSRTQIDQGRSDDCFEMRMIRNA